MHCQNCGAALPPGAAACPACGTFAPQAAPPAAAEGQGAAGLLNFAGGAKGLALLSLLLPLVTVSCAGQKLVSWSGLHLATGRLPPPPRVPGARDAPQMPLDSPPDLLLIAVAVVILTGLAATIFLRPRPRAAMAGAAAAAGAGGLLYYDVMVRIPAAFYDAMLSGVSGRAGGAPLGPGDRQGIEMLKSGIQVEPATGFWLALGALTAAFILCLMALGRDRPPSG